MAKPIKLAVLNDEKQHFLLTFERPGRVEVQVVDGNVVATVYDGATINTEQKPLFLFDGTVGDNDDVSR